MARPLNEILSVAVEGLRREFDKTAKDQSAALSLDVYANLLRVIPDAGLDVREIPKLARTSKRTVKWNITVAQRFGWVVQRDKRVRLMAQGKSARDASARCLEASETEWRHRIGGDVVSRLRSSLETLVSQFDIELPHHPCGYGPADGSVTGGVAGRWGYGHTRLAKGLPGLAFDPGAEHDAAEVWEKESGGRLYVRETGQDWRPVPRGAGDTVSELPLFALLSQALLAFAIDYEGCGGLSLARSGNLLKLIADDGVEIVLRQARVRGKVAMLPADGTLAGLERHAYAAVDPDPHDTRKGRFTLTEKGKLVRDAYDGIVAAIERRWMRRYGDAVVRELRDTLETAVSAEH